LTPSVLTIGTIKGGEARNIIPQTVLLSGTIRSFDLAFYHHMKERMHQIDQGIAMTYNVSIQGDIRDYYPPLVNDSTLYQLAKSVLGENETRPLKPMMFAEDFSFYQRKYKGLMVMLGTRNEAEGYIHPLHSCYFNFNEEILLKGIAYYLNLLNALDAILIEGSDF
jgi:metal-dependent amidase/aminoacylase/carboxypeptidase family protein